MLSRGDNDSSDIEFCVEYLDRATEIAAQDESFDSPAEAERHATEQFSLAPDSWREEFPTLD